MAGRHFSPAGRVIVLLLLIGVGAGVYFKWFHESEPTDKVAVKQEQVVIDAKASATSVPAVQVPGQFTVAAPVKDSKVNCGAVGERACVVCLSQWPGHMAGIIGLGGLTTQVGSFASKVMSSIDPSKGPGLNVEIRFIEEPDKKNAALQSGDCDAVWQTTDELPMNLPGFAAAGLMPQSYWQVDWSRGGDGCVAVPSVKKPRDMLTHQGAVLKFSPDHTVLEFWLTNSDLNPKELAQARANISFSMDDYTYARNLFCQHKIEIACLWEPDLQQALACRKDEGAYVVFSSKDASTLVADNLLALTKNLQARMDIHEKIARIFKEGARIGQADKAAAARLVSTVAPRFRDEIKYEGTLASFDWVRWNDLGDNIAYFGLDGNPPKFDAVYKQADSIWSEYTEKDGSPVLTQRFAPNVLRNSTIVKAIWDSEKALQPQAVIVAEKPVYKPEVIAKATPKMVKPVIINFDTGAFDVTKDLGALSILKRDVLSQVNLAESMGLRIEGNTDDVGSQAFNGPLSQKRAESVRAFMISQGVPDTRIVAKGNGSDNPVCNAKTPDCRAQNRRTEIIFVPGQ